MSYDIEQELAKAKQRISYLVAEAHGWQPKLAKAKVRIKELEECYNGGDSRIAIAYALMTAMGFVWGVFFTLILVAIYG